MQLKAKFALANNGIRNEVTQSQSQVVFEIKMKFSIEKSDEAKATPSQSRIFFEEKDEEFSPKQNFKKNLIAYVAIYSRRSDSILS
jgi:hypothetical protein